MKSPSNVSYRKVQGFVSAVLSLAINHREGFCQGSACDAIRFLRKCSLDTPTEPHHHHKLIFSFCVEAQLWQQRRQLGLGFEASKKFKFQTPKRWHGLFSTQPGMPRSEDYVDGEGRNLVRNFSVNFILSPGFLP